MMKLDPLAPAKTIKPTVIQIYEPQTIMLGNLAYRNNTRGTTTLSVIFRLRLNVSNRIELMQFEY